MLTIVVFYLCYSLLVIQYFSFILSSYLNQLSGHSTFPTLNRTEYLRQLTISVTVVFHHKNKTCSNTEKELLKDVKIEHQANKEK